MRLLDFLAWTALVSSGAATALSFLASLGWPLELFSHFAVQYALETALCVVYFLLRRGLRPALAAAVVLAINAVAIWPYYQSPENMASAKLSPPLRILVLNLSVANDDVGSVMQTIERENPDILLFHEVSLSWAKMLEPLQATYPFTAGEPANSIFGILIVSRLPIESDNVVHLGPRERAAIQVHICRSAGTGCLTIVGAHPPPPVSRDWASERDTVLLEAAAIANSASSGPVVLAGDFNITPWSPIFSRILAESGLRDSALGFGIDPTWFSASPALGLPIDHILVSPDIAVTGRHVGPYVGSDHFPVIADLAF